MPVIVLHGGPAAGHRNMRPYAALAGKHEVVLYDQSGCGRSARPADLALYTPERYADELDAVRHHIGAERAILLGHSWGGMLALAYMRRYAAHVGGLVLAGTAPRLADYAAAADRWLIAMGPEARTIVRRAEREGHTGDSAYQALTGRYYAEHLCRLDPWPNGSTRCCRKRAATRSTPI